MALVLGAELLTPDAGAWNQSFRPLTRLLLVPGGNPELWVNYPMLPWLEPVSFGILFGHWLVDNRRKAFGRALKLGLIFLFAFLVLRAMEGLGGSASGFRSRGGNTWIDFLNVVKYPPSITFELLTMGVNLIILRLFERASESENWRQIMRPLVVFGRVPLFFYLLHLFLYAGLGLWLMPEGVDILEMYPYWLLGLLILYPVCLWYGRLKRRRPARSVLRFL